MQFTAAITLWLISERDIMGHYFFVCFLFEIFFNFIGSMYIYRFFFLLQVGSSLENFKDERRAECKRHATTWQPQVVAIGNTITNIQQVYVLLDSVAYPVSSIIKGVDLCFKVFQVFNME